MQDILVKINGDASGFEKATNKAIGLSKSFAGAIGISLGTAGILALSKSLIDISDKYSQLDGRLRLVTKSSNELTAARKGLYEIAQNTRVEYEATVDLYTRLARSTDQLGLSQSQLLSITDSINKALIVSGASGESAAAALMQLGQGMASGVLRGEELNSIMEQTPRLAQMIADGLGITIGQLRQYGKDGKLSADAVSAALLSQADKINGEFQRMPQTVVQAMVKLTNAFKDIVNDSNNAAGATGGIADAISSIAATLEANKGGIINAFVQIAGAINFAVTQAANLANAISKIPGGKGAFGGGAAGFLVGSRFGPVGAGLGTAIGASTGGIYDWASQQKNFSFAGIRSKSYGATGSWESADVNAAVETKTTDFVKDALAKLKLGDSTVKKGGGSSAKNQIDTQFSSLYDNLMPVEAENKRYQESLKLISEFYGSRADLTDKDDKLRIKLAEEHQKKLDEINGVTKWDSDLKALEDRYKTEAELEADRYKIQLDQLDEFLKNSAISEQEYRDKKERAEAVHLQNLLQQEKDVQYQINNLRSGAVSQGISLLNLFAQKNKAAAIAAIAIEKAQAIAQVITNIAAARAKALAIYGPTPAGFAAATAATVFGAVQIAAIAATGVMQASSALSSGSSSSSSSYSGSSSSSSSGSSASSSAGVTRRIDVYGLNKNDLYTGEQVAKLLNEFLADGGTLNIK